MVDWNPEQRGDLELLIKENVAIVSYSCKGIKLLKDCKVDGNYGFLGMSRKEQVVKLNNADEVKANLLLGGIGIAGNLSAEMARGSTLDVAMIMIGKVKTTWAKVQADELKGDCDGATHFVKGAGRRVRHADGHEGPGEERRADVRCHRERRVDERRTEGRGKRAFEMGCMRNGDEGALRRPPAGLPWTRDMDASRKCDMGGSPHDCGVAGLINIATGNPMGQNQIERACMQQDGLACAVKAANKK